MKLLLAAGTCAAFLLAGAANAQQIVKEEPRAGALMPGQKILVDNGKCPKGQVQEVTGGSGGTGTTGRGNNAAAAAGGGQFAGAQQRQYRCVPRPS